MFCAKAVLRFLNAPPGVDRNVLQDGDGIVGLYDMTDIQSEGVADPGESRSGALASPWLKAKRKKERRRAKMNSARKSSAANDEKGVALNGTGRHGPKDGTHDITQDISPRTLRRKERIEKNDKFSSLPILEKVSKLTKIFDRALRKVQSYNRANQEKNDRVNASKMEQLKAARASITKTMPWVEISVPVEELRLQMLGYASHIMFETYWRDNSDSQYMHCMKWHRKTIGYLVGQVEYLNSLNANPFANNAETAAGEDLDDSTVALKQWNSMHRPLFVLCISQMALLHLHLGVTAELKKTTNDLFYDCLVRLDRSQEQTRAKKMFIEACHKSIVSEFSDMI